MSTCVIPMLNTYHLILSPASAIIYNTLRSHAASNTEGHGKAMVGKSICNF